MIQPGWILPVIIFVKFAALPALIPQVLYVGGFSFAIFEPLLLVAAVWALWQPSASTVVRYVAPFSVLCIVMTLWSLFAGADISKVGSDVRLPFYVAVSMYIASKVVGTPHQSRCVRALLVSLWFSAIMVVVASAINLKLAGRSEAASLNLNDLDAATRFLTPADFLAVVVVVVCVVWTISGDPRQFSISVWLIPAGVLMVMSFSRNHLLGLAAAIVFAMLAFRSARSIVAAIRTAAIIGVVALLLQVGVANVFAPIPGATFVATQADSYVSRVVDGIKPEARATDPSVAFREKEDIALTEAIPESPLFGHGFGYAYKSPTGPPGSFFHEEAPYYAHNFYLWWLLKVGIFGMLTFVWMAFVPLLRVMFNPVSTMKVAVASAASGLLAISFVAPIPNDSSGSVLLGALLGIAAVLAQTRNRGTTSDAATARLRPEPATL